MKKDIKDYLPFYIGCEVSFGLGQTGVLVGMSKSEVEPDKWVVIVDVGAEWFVEWYVEETIPHLRPLSDMTEEDMRKIYALMGEYDNAFHVPVTKIGFGEIIKGYQPNIIEVRYEGRVGAGYSSGCTRIFLNRISAKAFQYLLSKGFDLFGLIEAGLAIDSTKLPKPDATQTK